MEAYEYWKLFLETGVPEYYLLYHNALKMERTYVPDNSGYCTPGHGLQ